MIFFFFTKIYTSKDFSKLFCYFSIEIYCIILNQTLFWTFGRLWYEPPHDKTNKMACAPSEDSDQTGRMPSLIWVFAERTDHFVDFVMLQLFLIFWNSFTFFEEEKKYIYRPTLLFW